MGGTAEETMQPDSTLSPLVLQVIQGLRSDPQSAQSALPELESKIVGQPLNDAERAEVPQVAAGMAGVAADKKRGLSPMQGVIEALKSRESDLAAQKAALYAQDEDEKPMSRSQKVALAVLALAPVLGAAFGGNMGGVAGGQGAMLGGQLLMKQKDEQDARADKKLNIQANEISNREANLESNITKAEMAGPEADLATQKAIQLERVKHSFDEADQAAEEKKMNSPEMQAAITAHAQGTATPEQEALVRANPKIWNAANAEANAGTRRANSQRLIMQGVNSLRLQDPTGYLAPKSAGVAEQMKAGQWQFPDPKEAQHFVTQTLPAVDTAVSNLERARKGINTLGSSTSIASWPDSKVREYARMLNDVAIAKGSAMNALMQVDPQLAKGSFTDQKAHITGQMSIDDIVTEMNKADTNTAKQLIIRNRKFMNGQIDSLIQEFGGRAATLADAYGTKIKRPIGGYNFDKPWDPLGGNYYTSPGKVSLGAIDQRISDLEAQLKGSDNGQ